MSELLPTLSQGAGDCCTPKICTTTALPNSSQVALQGGV